MDILAQDLKALFQDLLEGSFAFENHMICDFFRLKPHSLTGLAEPIRIGKALSLCAEILPESKLILVEVVAPLERFFQALSLSFAILDELPHKKGFRLLHNLIYRLRFVNPLGLLVFNGLDVNTLGAVGGFSVPMNSVIIAPMGVGIFLCHNYISGYLYTDKVLNNEKEEALLEIKLAMPLTFGP